MLWYILTLVIGIMLGIIFHIMYEYIIVKEDGFIVFNKTDPDFATAGIEFHKGANEIVKKKRVILSILTQL